ncbi:hypothetical protein SXCC_02208 [Gluconacetobacter sp. SXCC-1]|nr:hypothetical protein SXCC_02208 [Gluconacetobacter sp. SXCC-1]
MNDGGQPPPGGSGTLHRHGPDAKRKQPRQCGHQSGRPAGQGAWPMKTV